MKELIVESNQSAAQNVTSHLSNVLKQHKRTGTGEKSFTCSACDKTFTPSNGLLCFGLDFVNGLVCYGWKSATFNRYIALFHPHTTRI